MIAPALEIQAELGEHPIWNVGDQCLYWLDIVKATVNRFDPSRGCNDVWSLPQQPGCFAFREDGSLIIALRDGIYEFALPQAKLSRLVQAEHPSYIRFNDGKTDRQGRLWVGTSHVDNDPDKVNENAYFRFDGHRLDRVLTGVGIANGTAFSADGRTMYRAQTEARVIWAYDYDTETGRPSNPRIFARVPQEFGLPDGATVDSQGGYWVAMATPPEGGRPGVARYTGDGRMDMFIDSPVPLTTMPAFGGPEMSRLYVTTARLEAQMPYATPEVAGSIFAIDTGFQGVPETPFRQARPRLPVSVSEAAK